MDYRSLRAPALPVTAGPAKGSCHVKLAMALHKKLVFKIHGGNDTPSHPCQDCIPCPLERSHSPAWPMLFPRHQAGPDKKFSKATLKKKKKRTTKKPK